MSANDGDALLWRIERACLAAWPTTAEQLLDGWLLRTGGGDTRRLNSLNPTEDGPRDPAPILADARACLAAIGKPLIVRVPAIAPGLDAALDRLGFGPPQDETLTLLAAPATMPSDPAIGVAETADPAWLDARAALAALDDDARRQLAATAALVPAPAAFARVLDAGETVAVGYVALSGNIAVLEAIATHPMHRRRGHGRRLVAALIARAAEQGATTFCLQVAAANAPAIALYRGLGFTRELYRYHYRTA